jgi:glycosyltransferase involved in cell wall biosynthesis
MEPLVTVVIVTYNRRTLLARCLTAIAAQTCRLDHVLVVDNASTDDTREWLKAWLPTNLPQARLIALYDNLGGAGGFATGMQAAMDDGADWIWMMDDDAEPAPNALSVLLESLEDGTAIYGSIATPGDGRLCWPLFSTDNRAFNTVDSVPAKVAVMALPFLGILISRPVIDAVGLPDVGYFIAGDDTDYCFRARTKGIPIVAVGGSHLIHPPSEYYQFGFGALAPVCFRIVPWKRYYDVRNRILTSFKYGTTHVWTRTIPGTVLRLVATLVREPHRWLQIKAYVAGTFDGLRGLKGQRHKRWGLGS